MVRLRGCGWKVRDAEAEFELTIFNMRDRISMTTINDAIFDHHSRTPKSRPVMNVSERVMMMMEPTLTKSL